MKKKCKDCQLIHNSNKVIRDQAERIVELKKQINDLSISLEQYRKRESEIVESMAYAKKKTEELTQEAQIKFALECERLRVYRNKWLRYIKDKSREGELAKNIEKTNEVLKECQIQLEDMLYTDLGINQSVADSYIYERERIDGEPSLNYQKIIDKAKEKVIDDDIMPNDELEKMLAKLKI
ncbi:MAG: hypothetical protein ACOCWI_04290 [Bacillota bacterium]